MKTHKFIPDVYLLSLESEGGRLVILHESDHLLRRFGQVEYQRLYESETTPFAIRAVADEIWSVLTGEVSLTMVDKRKDSPLENQTMQFDLTDAQPQAVLIPYGVAHQFTASKNAQMIRITTHVDGEHAEDRVLTQDEIDSLLSSA